MALRSARSYILSILLSVFLLSLFPSRVGAEDGSQIPPLEEFIGSITNGNQDSLRGIYIPEILAGRIVSQPEDDPAFVSGEENTLTQFTLAAKAGSTGLLAHNYLAGKYFARLQEGQVFYLVYGDGHVQEFVVADVQRFRALDPENVWSSFLDLKHGTILSSAKLFSKVYDQPGKVILQTCIRANGRASWGRLFLIAEPSQTTRAQDDLQASGKR
ncbi:MAG: hypothetical protein QM730_24610 [Anaerolineales bacterium]